MYVANDFVNLQATQSHSTTGVGGGGWLMDTIGVHHCALHNSLSSAAKQTYCDLKSLKLHKHIVISDALIKFFYIVLHFNTWQLYLCCYGGRYMAYIICNLSTYVRTVRVVLLPSRKCPNTTCSSITLSGVKSCK